MTEKARSDSDPEIPGCTDVDLVRSGTLRIYRCRRHGTGEPVTALVYPARVDSSTAADFTEQVNALGSLAHPQVVPVLDSGLADGHPYVITTPDAGTLTEQIQGRLRSPAELAVLGRNLAAGLAAIHSAGLVHGSLTPDAVVIGPDGGQMLSCLTLGLGQHTGHAALSSPRQLYLAPETLRDGTTTAVSDLYALGAVLHTAISGQPPLAARMGETAGEHILRVLHEPPARLEVLPDRFADVLAQLLEKDPARRPRDAEAVAASLAALQPEPTGASGGGRSMPLVRPVTAAPPEISHADPAGSEPAGPSTPPPEGTPSDRPAVPEFPRPALMNRGRLRSWPVQAPATGAVPDSAPVNVPPPAEPPPDAPAAHQPSASGSSSGPGAHRQLSYDQPREPGAHRRPPDPAAAEPPPPAWNAGAPEYDDPPPGPAADTVTEPRPQRRPNWLLVSAGVAVVAALVAVLAMANRQDQPERQPTRTAQRTPAPKPTLSVRLNPPADHKTYVDLSWTGDPDLNYVVVVAQMGKTADTKLVYKRKKYRVPVVPGVKYCFVIQATDGIRTSETEPWPIRDAQCGL